MKGYKQVMYWRRECKAYLDRLLLGSGKGCEDVCSFREDCVKASNEIKEIFKKEV